MGQSFALTIIKPDDWHLHLRDGSMLGLALPHSARQFKRAIVMPNLVSPITTVDSALAYKNRIIKALPRGLDFEPLMALYLTDETDKEHLRQGFHQKVFIGAKLYPAGATTNSAFGVTDVKNIYNVLGIMEEIGMPLLVHGEVVGESIDIFDREAVFIEKVMIPLLQDFPNMKVVFEHLSTACGVDFISSSGPNVAATITAHHMMINRNSMFLGGLRPHMYCLPVVKREADRLALRKAATSGSEKFFLGTDSAPHSVDAKESACGCAGVFSAATALEFYMQIFEEEDALENFELFASIFGANFYGLPVNKELITIKRRKRRVPKKFVSGEGEVVIPFFSDEEIHWEIVNISL